MIESENSAIEEIRTDGHSQHLQRRVLRLLLQHSAHLFRNQFRYFFVNSALPQMPLLQHYDRYLKLQALSNELLDDILPRIRRQLSLKTSNARLSEESPTRGDIDWQRTIERGWSDTPGLPAVQFETRLRQHTLDTPENLLTVAILLAFRRELSQVLQESLEDEAFSALEESALANADERAARELAAAYARALIPQASQAQIDRLAREVAARLRPGPNPYRDLLAWWQRFTQFHVGRAAEEQALSLVSKRDDQKTDAWLYELWIALEMLHLLHEEGDISASDVRIDTDTLQYTFTWRQRRFRLLYNRQLETMTSFESDWEHGPATRPDYTIERETPLRVPKEGPLIWREPPVVFDAKYYLGGSDPTNTHGPIKKLLGDMTLLGAEVGALFLPRLPAPPEGEQVTRVVKRSGKQYERDSSQQVSLYSLEPTMPLADLQARLRSLLDLAAQRLPERPQPTCQGLWIDADNINASRFALPEHTIVCPKPHIGPGVFDLVNVDSDCLKNPRLCHVIGQSIVTPFVVRVTTQQQLLTDSSALRQRSDVLLLEAESVQDELRAEQIRQQIFAGIGRAVEQYARLFGNTRSIEENFERWVFGAYWKQHPRSLSRAARNCLVSGEVVWQNAQEVDMPDWAAPAIQFCRALEYELKRRLYEPRAAQYVLRQSGFTIGTLTFAYNNRSRYSEARTNWNVLLELVRLSNSDVQQFEDIVQRMLDEQLREKRNMLAHGETISKEVAGTLRDCIIGDRRRAGILCWLAEHVDSPH